MFPAPWWNKYFTTGAYYVLTSMWMIHAVTFGECCISWHTIWLALQVENEIANAHKSDVDRSIRKMSIFIFDFISPKALLLFRKIVEFATLLTPDDLNISIKNLYIFCTVRNGYFSATIPNWKFTVKTTSLRMTQMTFNHFYCRQRNETLALGETCFV